MNKAAPPQPWQIPDLVGLIILFPIAVLFVLLDVLIFRGVIYGCNCLGCVLQRAQNREPEKPAPGY